MKNLLDVNDVILNYYFIIGGLFLSYLVYRIFHTLYGDSNYLQTKYNFRGHTWRSIQCNKSIPYNIHCTVCHKLMMPIVGLFCECCAVSACKKCHRRAEKKFKCKPTSWPHEKPFKHQWTNIGWSGGDHDDHTQRYFCSWCQRIKVSSENINNLAEPCDFQKYRKLIIPPSCVEMQNGRVIKIKPLLDEDWQPLIIFANRKSGSNGSDEVLSLFRGLLNPIQVVDIGSASPESVVRWLTPNCRVLAAGGDGTVAWVLNALADAHHAKAPVGIIPMGTGNDLSRVLGWGPTCSSHLDAHNIIRLITQAIEQPLDRWKVTIRPKKRRLGRLGADRIIHAYNYASVGVDAQIALDFHHARTQFLYRYANRTLNYLTYLVMGAGRVLDDGGCEGLERRISVRVGAKPKRGSEAAAAMTEGSARGPASEELSLPPLQALLLLNIPSWCAGINLWSMGSEDEVGEQSVCDGKLEVIGISSSIHIARLQCGLAEPYRFTQSSAVYIDLNGSCAMQVDGEPWMQRAATISIENAGQALVLKNIAEDIYN